MEPNTNFDFCNIVFFFEYGASTRPSPSQMEETKKALVLESGAKGVTTLHELITTTNAKAVERHGSPFPAGQAPSRLGGSNLYLLPAHGPHYGKPAQLCNGVQAIGHCMGFKAQRGREVVATGGGRRDPHTIDHETWCHA